MEEKKSKRKRKKKCRENTRREKEESRLQDGNGVKHERNASEEWRRKSASKGGRREGRGTWMSGHGVSVGWWKGWSVRAGKRMQRHDSADFQRSSCTSSGRVCAQFLTRSAEPPHGGRAANSAARTSHPWCASSGFSNERLLPLPLSLSRFLSLSLSLPFLGSGDDNSR